MFYGEKVNLRLLREEEAEELIKYFNDYDFRKNLLNVIPFSLKEEQDFIKNSWEWKRAGKAYIFGIEEIETNNLIGSCGIMDVNWINRSAAFGIGIWKKARQNQGLGTDATKTILKFAFNDLGLHSIMLEVHEFNKRGIHVYEKIGFKDIGKKREAIYRNGKYYDTIFMDILDKDFTI